MAGKSAPAVAGHLHNGIRHLTLHMGESVILLVPAWMTEVEAANIKVTDQPCLPLSTLLELRNFLDLTLISAAGGATLGKRGDDEDMERASAGSIPAIPTFGTNASTAQKDDSAPADTGHRGVPARRRKTQGAGGRR
jgi:hypothetical protein